MHAYYYSIFSKSNLEKYLASNSVLAFTKQSPAIDLIYCKQIKILRDPLHWIEEDAHCGKQTFENMHLHLDSFPLTVTLRIFLR